MVDIRDSVRDEAVQKLTRLPKDVKIHKRPLLRPAIPSPFAGAGKQKIVYLGSKTPFMSALKRVKNILEHVEKRATQSEVAHHQSQRRKGRASRNIPAPQPDPEVVIVKATGKAIDKALGLALFLQQQTELNVKVGTSTMTAIDDIEQHPTTDSKIAEEFEHDMRDAEGKVVKADASDAVANSDGHDEVPESRIRHTSVIEIHVSLHQA